MRGLLVLLTALTMGFGVGAAISIDRTPAFTDDSRNGYYFAEEPALSAILALKSVKQNNTVPAILSQWATERCRANTCRGRRSPA